MQLRKYNSKPTELELQADVYLINNGGEAYTTHQMSLSDRRWRNHCDQASTTNDYAIETRATNAALNDLSMRTLEYLTNRANMTARQIDILRIWASDCRLSNRDIAVIMNCSHTTVNNDLKESFTKLRLVLAKYPYLGLREVLVEVFGVEAIKMAN